jgi:hypothetical protein
LAARHDSSSVRCQDLRDGSGLDLCPSMFAPRLLGCPGTGRQDPVLMSLCLTGLRYSSGCRSIPVTQVFKKLPLSSGLLIRGFGVQVPGGAPVLTWCFMNHRSSLRARLHPFCSGARSVLVRRSDGGLRPLVKERSNWSRPVIGCGTVRVEAESGRPGVRTAMRSSTLSGMEHQSPAACVDIRAQADLGAHSTKSTKRPDACSPTCS